MSSYGTLPVPFKLWLCRQNSRQIVPICQEDLPVSSFLPPEVVRVAVPRQQLELLRPQLPAGWEVWDLAAIVAKTLSYTLAKELSALLNGPCLGNMWSGSTN